MVIEVIEGLLHEIINSIIIKGDFYFKWIALFVNNRTFIFTFIWLMILLEILAGVSFLKENLFIFISY